MPEVINKNTLLGSILHEWTIQEYEHHERNLAWYVIMGAMGLFLVGYGLFTGNFLFALIIILFAIILFLRSHQAPNQVLFQIAELGVVVGGRFYPYAEMKDFYIIYNPPSVKTLFLNPNSVMRPILRIPLLDKNPVEVKHSLRAFLPEDLEKEKEPLSEEIGRSWKIH